MTLALKRAPLQSSEQEEEALASKRRRFSPDEVRRELEATGKRQPVLSFLLGTAQADGESPGAACRGTLGGGAGAAKRAGAAQGRAGGYCKRLRQCEPDILPLKELVPPTQIPRQLSLVRPRPPAGCGTVLLGLLKPAGVMVDPRGTAFVVTESGYLLAELPSSWRPRITLAGNRRVQIAKVAIDAAGTAYLFSDEGLPVTAVPAVSLTRDACNGSAVTIQLLDQTSQAATGHPSWMSQAACAAEDPLSPSTSVPSPSGTEAEDDIDVTMDWEPM